MYNLKLKIAWKRRIRECFRMYLQINICLIVRKGGLIPAKHKNLKRINNTSNFKKSKMK